MKKPDDDNPFNGIRVPQVERVEHQQELKIPLLRYRRSSWVGLWLLILPLSFLLTALAKYHFGASFAVTRFINRVFDYLDGHSILTALVPIIVLGFPLLAMILNGMAIFHFASSHENRELLVTIKCRPFNIAIFLISFVVLVYAFMPDALP